MAKKQVKDFEKLVADIMREAEEDGEPVTREEAEDMAKMEQGATEIKNYTQATTEKKKKVVERKIDNEKKEILDGICSYLVDKGATEINMKNEVDLNFVFNGSNYTVKLTKHRPSK